MAFGASFFPRSLTEGFRLAFFLFLEPQSLVSWFIRLLHSTLRVNAVTGIGSDATNGANVSNRLRKDGDRLQGVHVAPNIDG